MGKKSDLNKLLRERAEEELRTGRKLSRASMGVAELLHELEVRQIELEIQNEELKKSSEELFNAKQLIQESLDRYEELYDYAPMAYFTVNASNNRILRANVAASDLLKVPKSAMYKNRFARYIEPDYTDTFHICIRKALKEPFTETCELKMQRNGNESFWALLEVRGSYSSNEVRIAAADITERKKIEQIKDDFIGMVSHELRTPLTVVMGAVKVAQTKGITKEEMDELLDTAAHGSENLSHLLENLIELSRVQSDRLKLNMQPEDIAAALNEIIGTEKNYHTHHKLVLDIKTLLPPADIDKSRLKLILHNLIDNAAKYSAPDTEITVTAKNEDGHILIGVNDHGKGIPKEEQEKLFAPFERLGESSTTKPGLGLGLIVCKRLVEAHGGKIWVDSIPGHGTTFRFTRPVAGNGAGGGRTENGRSYRSFSSKYFSRG